MTTWTAGLPAITICADVITGLIEVETGGWAGDDARWAILADPVSGMLRTAADAGPWAEDEEGMGRADEAVRDILGLTVSAWQRRRGVNGELFFATVTGRVETAVSKTIEDERRLP